MAKPLLRPLLALLLLGFPGATSAACSCPGGGRCLCILFGSELTFFELAQRIVDYAAASISVVAMAVFVVGALMVVLSGVKEEYKQSGKDMMIGSLIGLGVVLGSYALLRTVLYVIS